MVSGIHHDCMLTSMEILGEHNMDEEMIEKLKEIKAGQRLVYYSGLVPKVKSELFQLAGKLHDEGKVILFQRLLAREVPINPEYTVSCFEYIALGTKKAGVQNG